jgi:hypothetical protein
MPLITNFKEEYFYSLVRPKLERKKRRCLRCLDHFESFGPAHRLCGVCVAANKRVGARAESQFFDPCLISG